MSQDESYTPACPSSRFAFNLVAHAGAYSDEHSDAGGAGTILRVDCGRKLWAWFVRKCPSVPLPSSFYTSKFKDWDKYFDVNVVDLGPGDGL